MSWHLKKIFSEIQVALQNTSARPQHAAWFDRSTKSHPAGFNIRPPLLSFLFGQSQCFSCLIMLTLKVASEESFWGVLFWRGDVGVRAEFLTNRKVIKSDVYSFSPLFAGVKELDQIIVVLFTTHMFIGGFFGFILDNTIPGMIKYLS